MNISLSEQQWEKIIDSLLVVNFILEDEGLEFSSNKRYAGYLRTKDGRTQKIYFKREISLFFGLSVTPGYLKIGEKGPTRILTSEENRAIMLILYSQQLHDSYLSQESLDQLVDSL